MRIYRKQRKLVHDSTGYIQGAGLRVWAHQVKILWFTFIYYIEISEGDEWIRGLKERIKRDDEQQARETK